MKNKILTISLGIILLLSLVSAFETDCNGDGVLNGFDLACSRQEDTFEEFEEEYEESNDGYELCDTNKDGKCNGFDLADSRQNDTVDEFLEDYEDSEIGNLTIIEEEPIVVQQQHSGGGMSKLQREIEARKKKLKEYEPSPINQTNLELARQWDAEHNGTIVEEVIDTQIVAEEVEDNLFKKGIIISGIIVGVIAIILLAITLIKPTRD